MMYVTQPDLKSPIAKMQQEYRTSQPQIEATQSRRQSRSVYINRDQPIFDESQTSETTERDSLEAESTYEDTEPASEQKRFEDMTREEQVDYLSRPSPFLPKLSCQVKVADQTHIGKIVSRQGDTITFEARSAPRHRQFTITEMDEIKLLGFDK